MKPYICNDPIKHDGDDYAIGESIELDDKAAEPLLAIGAIALDVGAVLAAKDASGNTDDESDTDGNGGQTAGVSSARGGKKRKVENPPAEPAQDDPDADQAANAGGESGDAHDQTNNQTE